MIERINQGDLEMEYNEEDNSMKIRVHGKSVITVKFCSDGEKAGIEEMFVRALELWSKKYNGQFK